MADLPDRDKLLRNFGRCANWEEKYLYIIELGQRLPPLSEEAHNPDNIIQGCQSQVWIQMQQTDDGVIDLQGDSDAAIVNGLNPTPHPVPIPGTGSDDPRHTRQSRNP